MKYLSFELENFKGVAKLKIEIKNNSLPISLVGLNESGKTTILEGINYIGKHCQHIGNGQIEQRIKNRKIYKIKPKKLPEDFFDGSIKFSCKIKKNEDQNIYLSFSYIFKNDKCRDYKVEINNQIVDKNNINNKDIAEIITDLKNNLPDIILYSDFILKIPKKISFYTTYHKKKISKERLETIEKKELENLRNIEWRKILEDITKYSYQKRKKKISFQYDIVDYLDGEDGGDINNFDNKLTGLTKHINALITQNWLSKLSDQSSLKEIKLICHEKNQNKDEKRNFSFKAIGNDENIFDLSERSKGCQWFFAFMLFTEFRKYRKKNTIFLLDEPASNLHSTIQEAIVKLIRDLCTKDKGTGVIYSTHSSYLLDLSNIENMYIVYNTNDSSETKESKINIKIYNTNENDKKETKPIGDYLKLNLHIIKDNFEHYKKNKYFTKIINSLRDKNHLTSIIEFFSKF